MVLAPLTRPPQVLASDSATVAVQGAAGALSARLTDPFPMPGWQRAGARLANAVLTPPQKLALMRRVAGGTGARAPVLERADSVLIARWMVSLYSDQPFEGVILGAPSGAAAHLSSLLGFPFFSQHVLMGLRGKYPLDDTPAYIERCAATMRSVLQTNPDFEAILHYDPLHDRFLVSELGFIRLKYRRVPLPMRDFLRRNLTPRAQVLILDCGYPWQQAPLPEVHPAAALQLGGLGDVASEEFVRRVAPPGLDFTWRPESEWGTLPEFREDALRVAAELGLEAHVIAFDHPEDLSRWAFEGFRALWPEAERAYLDCFTHSCPAFNRWLQAPPLWLPFLGQDSLRFVRTLEPTLPAEVLLSLHPSFADPEDLATVAEWEQLLAAHRLRWVGIDRDTYPSDLAAYGDYVPSLRAIIAERSHRYDTRTLPLAKALAIWERFSTMASA